MKRPMNLMAFCMLFFAPLVGAYEYPLQFTPNPGYRGLVVAGYYFVSNTVVGNCSYFTVSGSSGRGGNNGAMKRYQQTCTWDLYGNLQGVAQGAPVVPVPISTTDGKVIYAMNGSGNSTGTDTKLPGRGFVNSPGSHYTWLTPNSNGVLEQMVYTHLVTLKSDGDNPVNITAVSASALLGATTIKKTTCIGVIKVGSTCSVTVQYDTTKVTFSKPLAYDTFRVDVISDAGASHDFIQQFTIEMPETIE